MIQRPRTITGAAWRPISAWTLVRSRRLEAQPPEPIPIVKPPPHARPAEPPPALFDEGPPAEIEEAPPRSRRGRSTAEEMPAPMEAEIEGSDVEAAAVPEVRPEEAEEASEELTEEKPRRRRRRSRRKKKDGEPAAAEGAADANGTPETAADAAPDDDDEEEPTAEVVKNWSVPSWDDLIASLHRPER